MASKMIGVLATGSCSPSLLMKEKKVKVPTGTDTVKMIGFLATGSCSPSLLMKEKNVKVPTGTDTLKGAVTQPPSRFPREIKVPDKAPVHKPLPHPKSPDYGSDDDEKKNDMKKEDKKKGHFMPCSIL